MSHCTRVFETGLAATQLSRLMTVRHVSRTATVVGADTPPFLAVGMTTPFGRLQPRKLLSVDGTGASWVTNHASSQPSKCQHAKHLI